LFGRVAAPPIAPVLDEPVPDELALGHRPATPLSRFVQNNDIVDYEVIDVAARTAR
jgi:hypothetical protein